VVCWSIEKFKNAIFLFKTGLRSRLCLSLNGRALLKGKINKYNMLIVLVGKTMANGHLENC
jgi:hypothetical protein